MPGEQDWWSQDQAAPTGDDFLKSLPPERAAQVKALSEGRMALPSGNALRSRVGQALLSDVAQYDPTFDVVNAPSRVATRKAFTSGVQSKNITSFNTAIGHLASLAKAADALNNSDWPSYNGIANSLGPQLGNADLAARLKTFTTARRAVVEELGRAFKGAAPDVHGSKDWEANFDPNQSPEALRASIQEAAGLLGSRVNALQNSYNEGMGTTNRPLPLLDSHAKEALDRFQSDDYRNRGYYAAVVGDQPPPSDDNKTPPAGGAAPPGGGGNGPGSPPPSPWDNPSPPKYKLDEGDRTFSTDKDKELATKAQALLANPNSTRADFDRLGAEYGGYKFNADLDRALAYRKKNPTAKITLTQPESGRQEATVLDKAGNVARAAALGSVDAVTFGTSNKIKAGVDAIGGRLTGDNRAIGDIYDQNLVENNLKTSLAAGTHPVANLVGETAGFLGGDAILGQGIKAAGKLLPGAAALTGRAIRPGARALAQDAAYGAAYGAGSSDSLAEIPGNVLSGAALGAAGGAVGRGVAKGVASALNPAVNAGVKRLTDAGITLTPGQILGAGGGIVGRSVKGIEDRLAGFPLVGDAINSARHIGKEDLNRTTINDVLAPIGGTANDIGHAGIADMQRQVGDAIDKALQPINAAPDAQLARDVRAAVRDAKNDLSGDHLAAFNKTANREVEPYLRAATIAGADIKSIKQGLDAKISNLRGEGSNPQNRDLADALDGVKDAFLGFAQRVDPSAAADYSKALSAYALSKRVSAAAAKSPDGIFTVNQFKQAVSKRGYGTTTDKLARGDAPFQQRMTDASTIMPSSVPDSGTGGRAALGHALGMIAGRGGGAALGGSAGYYEGGGQGALLGAALGAGAFSRPGLRASQWVLSGSRGKPLTTLGDILRANAGLGGAVGTPAALQRMED